MYVDSNSNNTVVEILDMTLCGDGGPSSLLLAIYLGTPQVLFVGKATDTILEC